jgi:hypothetical protein
MLGINNITKFQPKPYDRLGDFLFVIIFHYGPHELISRIMTYDHYPGQNVIFVYCSMILFLIYLFVGSNDIHKFVYYSMILFHIYL